MAERLINIGKIVRNTTKMNVQNGQMEEIVNLRHEDGRLQPLSANVEIWKSLFANLPNYSFLFVHTGKNYKHLLGVNKDTKGVHYIGNIIDNDIVAVDATTELTTVVKEQIQVHQVGNLLCINDTKSVQYLQWKDNSVYVLIDIDYNGSVWSDSLSPLGGIKVRVAPTCNDLGVPQILMANGDLSENDINDAWGVGSANFSDTIASQNGASVIAQAKKFAKELGLLNGFQIGVVALELYDGSYAYTGAPFVIPQANDNGTRYTTTNGQEPDYESEDIEDIIEYAGSGVPLTEAYNYEKNPKGIELVRPKENWYGKTSVVSSYKKCSGVENFPISLGYDSYGELKVGNSQEAGLYFLDLFGVHNKKEIEDNGSDDRECEPHVFNLYDFNGQSMDCTRYASNRAVTNRSCLCIEDVNPVGESGLAFDGDCKEYGADCFNPPNAFAIMGTIYGRGEATNLKWHMSSQERPNNKACAWGALLTQKLQIYFENANNTVLNDIIKNVCVFVSSEIYQSDEEYNSTQQVPIYALNTWYTKSNGHKRRKAEKNGYTVYCTPKSNKKIKDQLSNTQVLYKAYSTTYKNIKTQTWIDIDLSDKLNVLEEGETLNIDASYQRQGIQAECAYLYNGRLHLGNITETQFSGYPINELEIPKQWNLKAYSLYSRSANYADDGDGGSSFSWGSLIANLATLSNNLTSGGLLMLDSDLRNEILNAHDPNSYFTSGSGGRVWFDNDDRTPIKTWVFTFGSDYTIANSADAYSVYYNGNRYYAEHCVLISGVTLDNDTYEAIVDGKYIVNVNASNTATFTIDGTQYSVAPNGTFTYNNTTYTATESYYITIDTDDDTEYKYAKLRSDSSFDNVRQLIEEDANVSSVLLHKISSKRFLKLVVSRLAKDQSAFKYPVCKQWDRTEYTTDNIVYVITTVETADGTYNVGRLSRKGTYYPLNPMLSYPHSQAVKMRIGEITNVTASSIECTECVFELQPFAAMESGIFISGDIKPICWWQNVGGTSSIGTDKWGNTLNKQDYYRHTVSYTIGDADCPFEVEDGAVVGVNEEGAIVYRPNVLKVSSTENPMFFPADNTYQVGNGEIKAMCSNTVALSEGQSGDAPLYVFCSDGIYGLFVDSSGSMCYANSRPISREVINNPLSVTPIDDAVVYSSSRGLFMLSGSNNIEISKEAEGTPLQFADNTSIDYLDSMRYFVGKDDNEAWLHIPNMPTTEDFKDYLNGAHCGWCYKHTELWVSNPDYDYTYIYSQGGWSKVMRKIDYYINDYPRTYFVGSDENGDKRVWDAEENTNEPTECFFVTRPIVVDGEMAKTFTRAWAYGDFNVEPNEATDQVRKHKASIIVYGSQDGSRYSMIGIGGSQGKTRDIVAKLHRMSMRYIRIAFVGKLKYDSILECLGIEVKQSWGQDSSTKQR